MPEFDDKALITEWDKKKRLLDINDVDMVMVVLEIMVATPQGEEAGPVKCYVAAGHHHH